MVKGGKTMRQKLAMLNLAVCIDVIYLGLAYIGLLLMERMVFASLVG